LLEKDYRVYYHWHIDNIDMEDMIKDILSTSSSLEDFLEKYNNILGKDILYLEINRLLYQETL